MSNKRFLQDDFLLTSKTAQRIYQEISDLPIYDFHCHLPAEEILENKHFANLTELWLAHDHYKWRLMRVMGADEELITGSANDYDKFCAYCAALEMAMGNPLYLWSHMELETYFDISLPITAENAPEIWNLANARIAQPDFCVRSLIQKSKVELIATTNDPAEALEANRALAADESFSARVVPTFRPDKALTPHKADFTEYITALSELRERPIDTFSDLKNALSERLDVFSELGSKITDHGVLDLWGFSLLSEEEANAVFVKGLDREEITKEELLGYQSTLMFYLASEYQKRGMVMQLHLGALRDQNTRMYEKLGENSGFDTIGNPLDVRPLAAFLNALDYAGMLPKTVLYSIHPGDNAALAALAATFTETGIRGKVQLGAPWWFNDHRIGMCEHFAELSTRSALSAFVGMVTDSRSFLSYTRHDYFRRVLCSYLAEQVENNNTPADESVLTAIARRVAYDNAKEYFEM